MKIRLLVGCREEHRAQAHCATLRRVADDRIDTTATTLNLVAGTSAEVQPEVVLLEHVPVEEDRLWSTLHRLALVSPTSRVLVLCDHCTDRLITSFVAHGVSGSVAANGDPSLWVKAVMAVRRGESWFARAAVLQALRRQLAIHTGEPSRAADEERLLTAREREILALIGSGMSNKEIGRALNISDQTVKTHLHHVYVKLQRSGRYKAWLGEGAAHPVAALHSPLRESQGSLVIKLTGAHRD